MLVAEMEMGVVDVVGVVGVVGVDDHTVAMI